METRRERIARLLLEGDYAPSEIGRLLDLPMKTVLEDLRHIARSRKYGVMRMQPARCRKCGFVFKPEIKIPTKCPKCKSTWIEEPRFRLFSE